MHPPTKLDRLLFRHLGFALKAIHARILRVIGRLEAKSTSTGHQAIIDALTVPMTYSTMQRECDLLRHAEFVTIDRRPGLCPDGTTRTFAQLSLTKKGQAIIAKADEFEP